MTDWVSCSFSEVFSVFLCLKKMLCNVWSLNCFNTESPFKAEYDVRFSFVDVTKSFYDIKFASFRNVLPLPYAGFEIWPCSTWVSLDSIIHLPESTESKMARVKNICDSLCNVV